MSAALQMAQQVVGGGHPSLDLNFVAGAWPQGVSFSRASGATVNCWARYGDNLLTTGSFNTGTAHGWFVTGAASLSVASNEAVVTGVSNYGDYAGVAVFATASDRTYRLTVNVRSSSGAVQVRAIKNGGDYAILGAITSTATTTTSVTFTFRTSGGFGALLQFVPYAGNAGQQFFFDDVVVQELTLWQPGMDWLGPEMANLPWVTASGYDNITSGSGSQVTSVPVSTVSRSSLVLPDTRFGRKYKVAYRIDAADAATQLFCRDGVSPGTGTVTAAGNQIAASSDTVGLDFVASANGSNLLFVSSFGTTGFSISQISVREQNFTLMNVLVPANVPRIAYDPVTGVCLGAMVEPQRTNLIFNSTKLDVLGGYDAGTFFTNVASVPAPDGSTNAWRLTPGITAAPKADGAANIGNRVFVEVGTANGTYATSIWVKTDAIATDFSIMVLDKGSDMVKTKVDVVSTGAWTRVAAVGTTSGVSVGTRVLIATRHPVLVFGWQAEAGAEPTSYIPTAGAAATRAGDVPGMSPIPWYSPLGGTLVAEAQVYNSVTNNYGRIVGISAPNQGTELMINNATVRHLVVTAGGNQAEYGVLGLVQSGVPFKTAATFVANNFKLAVNGMDSGSDTAGDIPAANNLSIGYSSAFGNYQLNGYIRRIRYYPRAMTAAELQAVTK